jgi:hypothetical protein
MTHTRRTYREMRHLRSGGTVRPQVGRGGPRRTPLAFASLSRSPLRKGGTTRGGFVPLRSGGTVRPQVGRGGCTLD